MNNIEKMYENCGIKKERKGYCDYDGVTCPYDHEDCHTGCPYWGEEIPDYPPFTAEKQLSLMAFLINRKVGLSFKAEQGEITVEAISRGLAGIVNRIWQSLTEEERKQIRSILNGTT